MATREVRLDGMHDVRGERCIFLSVIFAAGGGIVAFLLSIEIESTSICMLSNKRHSAAELQNDA